jgi:hypothetical protein
MTKKHPSLHSRPSPSPRSIDIPYISHPFSDPKHHIHITMSESDVKKTIQQLHSLSESNLSNASALLSRAKISLLKLHALVPNASTSHQHLALAREVLEIGAFVSIRQRDPESFTRYFQQLQPFYSLPHSRWGSHDKHGNQSKITGLYLLLLLSQGDYAAFHTVIEGLEMAFGGRKRLDDDAFIQYPMRLEQALMEGSYDRVWSEAKGEKVPSPEFAVFSEVSPQYQQLSSESHANTFSRSSSTQSAPKSPRAASAHTPPFPSPTQRTSSSSNPKALLSHSHIPVVGSQRKVASISLLSKKSWHRVKRTFSPPATRSSRTRLNTLESLRPLSKSRRLYRLRLYYRNKHRLLLVFGWTACI